MVRIERREYLVKWTTLKFSHSVEGLLQPTVSTGKGLVTRKLQASLGTIQQTSQGTHPQLDKISS